MLLFSACKRTVVVSIFVHMSKDVSISELRASLRRWLRYVGKGGEVVITERGIPVARLSDIRSATLLERLTREGVISPPRASARPTAKNRTRVRATESVADHVSRQRR